MQSPVISVIIPVYNAAPYLEQCINSVLQQTLSDIEVIAVNDGSSDGSASLLDTLASSDRRLRVFHRPNQKVSATRNFGLQQAKASLISFCDADDYMEPTMLQELYEAVERDQADWAICNVTLHEAHGKSRTRLKLKDETRSLGEDKSLLIEELMRFYYDNANWNKLYRYSIIQQHRLHFEEGMHIWEDLLFNLQYAQFVSKFVLVNKPLYNYRVLSSALYSGNESSKIPQINRLYLNYQQFTLAQGAHAEWFCFREQMARIVYNQLLYQCEMHTRKISTTPFGVYKHFRSQLESFVPGIMEYRPEQWKGIRGLKKYLLHHRKFKLVAILVAAKVFLADQNPSVVKFA